jgi:hypothetical protein
LRLQAKAHREGREDLAKDAKKQKRWGGSETGAGVCSVPRGSTNHKGFGFFALFAELRALRGVLLLLAVNLSEV